jgi:hypothetical protein
MASLATLAPALGGYSLGLTGASALASLLGRVLSTYTDADVSRVAFVVSSAMNVWATIDVALFTLHRVHISVRHFSSRDKVISVRVVHELTSTTKSSSTLEVSDGKAPGKLAVEVPETHPVGAAEGSMATIYLAPFYAKHVHFTLGAVMLFTGGLLLVLTGCTFAKRMYDFRAHTQRPFPTTVWFPPTVGIGALAIGGANMGGALLSPLLLLPLIASGVLLVALTPAVTATALLPNRRRVEPPFRIFILMAPVPLCALVSVVTLMCLLTH